MMANIKKRPELNIVKKVHRFTHGNATEMSRLFEEAGMLTPRIKKAIDKVTKACTPCARSGRPKNSRKLSLKHVNKDFNIEVQADFMTVKHQGVNYELLNVSDCNTAFGERSIVTSRGASQMMQKFEESWICRHGPPEKFSADPEFCQPLFVKYLTGYNIKVNERPARSSHKNGRVERNNGLFKSIFEKMSKEKTQAGIELIVARASFASNMMFWRSKLTPFQLARGYLPGIVGTPQTILTKELMDAYIRISASRAIDASLKARTPKTIPGSMLKPGDEVYVFYKSTNKSVDIQWVTATVEKVRDHFVECRRSRKGPPMRVAFEHIRLIPSSSLAREITETYLEDEISEQDTNDIKTIEEMSTTDTDNIYTDIFGDESDTDEEEELKPIGTAASLFTTTTVGNPEKDIGKMTDVPRHADGQLQSTKQDTLTEIYKVVGGKQLTRSKMAFAPSWVLDSALQEELQSNWKDAYDTVDDREIGNNANVIPSHVLYKVKNEEHNTKRMKARLCPNGNRDRMKKTVRKDSATAQFDIIRLLLSIASILCFRLGCIDIKGAYLQSGPIKRTIYVRPPSELDLPRHILWKLRKLPYGITEAGRQWAKEIESWLIEKAGFRRVKGLSQFYVKRDDKDRIVMIAAKVTDDILIAGSIPALTNFATHICKRYKVRKVLIDDDIQFNGCEISQDHKGNVHMDMNSFLSKLNPIPINKHRRKQVHERSTPNEIELFRSLAGALLWLGSAVMPQASCIASFMQQKVTRLRVKDITDANARLKELRDIKASIRFITPASGLRSEISVTSFSDAAFNISTCQSYGQTGMVVGLLFDENRGRKGPIFHPIDWSSSKQRRVSHSSYGAEILACAETDDRGFHVKQAVQTLFADRKIKHRVNVDSKGLYDTITTLHEGREYRLRQTVQSIRDPF